jgi:hypothetical protein
MNSPLYILAKSVDNLLQQAQQPLQGDFVQLSDQTVMCTEDSAHPIKLENLFHHLQKTTEEGSLPPPLHPLYKKACKKLKEFLDTNRPVVPENLQKVSNCEK